MPSKSQAQHNLMEMVAHDPKAAKRVGIPQSVGKDFEKADKGKKFKKKHVGAVDRSSHWKGNPGFPSSEMAGHSPPLGMKVEKVKVKTTFKPTSEKNLPPQTYQHHESREKEVLGSTYNMHEHAPPSNLSRGSHGFGHGGHQRSGHMRLSGHSGAHRIGKRK
jgi:hypothetical protein